MQARLFVKIFFLSTILLSLFYCSGYFNMSNPDEADGDLSLALSDGSGYLSTDKYNEITPFLYRNPDNGRAYLFFASDRDGSYDIYYAEMDNKGRFSKPIKMDTNINTAYDETSPVVFTASDSENTNTYISFIIDRSPGAGIMIYTYQIDPKDFSTLGTSSSLGVTVSNIGLFNKTNVNPYLLISAEGTNFYLHYWGDAEGNWSSEGDGGSFTLPISKVDGFEINTPSWEQIFIFSAKASGKYQLYGGTITYVSSFSYSISRYISTYNDKDPCIDLETMKVYFASDRYGKGNYDLYRYNIITFDKVMLVTGIE